MHGTQNHVQSVNYLCEMIIILNIVLNVGVNCARDSTVSPGVLSMDYEINHLKAYKRNGSSWTQVEMGMENFSREYGAAPVFVDLDNDSKSELVVGSLDGKLTIYNNTNNTWTAWIETTPDLSAIDVGARSVPTFADLDGDGFSRVGALCRSRGA